MKKQRVQQIKEKSLFRKFVEVAWEQLQRKKALRILSKQEWSIDFLTYLLVRSTRKSSLPLALIVKSPSGETLQVISSATAVMPRYLDDSDDILNHLDEPNVVEEYIRRNGR